MAIFRSITAGILLICLTTPTTNALYEDQIGNFDWKRSFIGKVKHAKFDNNRLIVATHENVIASLSPKTGQILWRQTLEDPQQQQPYLLHTSKDAITVTGSSNSFYSRGWDIATGSLLWEWNVNLEKSGESLWSLQEDLLVHNLIIPESHIETTLYYPKTGDVRGLVRKITAPWAVKADSCVTTQQYLACISNGQLFWVDVLNENSKVSSESIQKLIAPEEYDYRSLHILQFDSVSPGFLLLHNNDAKLIELKSESAVVSAHNVLSNTIFADDSIIQLEVNVNNPEKLIKLSVQNLVTNDNTIVDVNYPRGLGAPYIVAAQCRGQHCELLLSSTDDALTLVKLPAGKVSWTREEALSNVISAEFFELPISELDASIENEFTTNGDVVSMLSHRLSTQFKQLSTLFTDKLFGGPLLSNNVLVRDDFGLHKIIVVATRVGKLFGIDTLTGSIVWSYRLPNVKPFNDKLILFVQRTAGHAPLPAQAVLLAQDSISGVGILFKFDPITGISQTGVEKLEYRVKQVLLLPNEDENHLKPILVIGENNEYHVHPSEGVKIVETNHDSIFVYLLENSALKGFKLGSNNKIEQVWNVNFAESELTAISVRPMSERVHSQGRVLPDRSVYYKYVNPNLIGVATLTDDPVHKHVLSVYLIDGVTGFVYYSSFHRRAKGPVHLVHSENWLVYSFFNERFRRFEVVAAELYEGDIQSNSTYFSSFAVSQLPNVQSQSYILPANPVSMTVTLTERGITNKFLLVGLSSGGVVEIPWLLLQPRFDNIPCGPEESCIPYMPEIPLPAEAIINYNQTLARIAGIEIAPARLESTSHILVYGLDLFYTRVAPSKTFDVLKEDFDHYLIVLVLSGLIIASYVTKYLAARKALRQAWK